MCRRRTPIGGCPPPAFSIPLPPHVNGRSPISAKPAPRRVHGEKYCSASGAGARGEYAPEALLQK